MKYYEAEGEKVNEKEPQSSIRINPIDIILNEKGKLWQGKCSIITFKYNFTKTK